MQNNDSNDEVYALNNVLFSSRTKSILEDIHKININVYLLYFIGLAYCEIIWNRLYQC